MNYKGGVRFSMLCGDRALENFEAKTEQMQTISNLLSAKPEKAAEAVSHPKRRAGARTVDQPPPGSAFSPCRQTVYPQDQKALAVFEQGMTPVLVRQFANLLLEQEKERPCWCALAMTRPVITTQPEASAVICVHSEKN